MKQKEDPDFAVCAQKRLEGVTTDTVVKAQKEADSLNTKFGGNLEPYQCPVCTFWHLRTPRHRAKIFLRVR